MLYNICSHISNNKLWQYDSHVILLDKYSTFYRSSVYSVRKISDKFNIITFRYGKIEFTCDGQRIRVEISFIRSSGSFRSLYSFRARRVFQSSLRSLYSTGGASIFIEDRKTLIPSRNFALRIYATETISDARSSEKLPDTLRFLDGFRDGGMQT